MALKLENEEQAVKAEAQRADIQKKIKNPLLDEEEREQLKKKLDRWSELLEEYRKDHPAPPVQPPVHGKPIQTIMIQEAPAPSQDPRQDLAEDSHLWTDLLQMAADQDKEAGRVYGKDDNTFCGVLNGFRCNSTILVPAKPKGEPMWSLKPIIDPINGWESKEEYDDFKKRYLEPYGKPLIGLLRELTKRHPLPNE